MGHCCENHGGNAAVTVQNARLPNSTAYGGGIEGPHQSEGDKLDDIGFSGLPNKASTIQERQLKNGFLGASSGVNYDIDWEDDKVFDSDDVTFESETKGGNEIIKEGDDIIKEMDKMTKEMDKLIEEIGERTKKGEKMIKEMDEMTKLGNEMAEEWNEASDEESIEARSGYANIYLRLRSTVASMFWPKVLPGYSRIQWTCVSRLIFFLEFCLASYLSGAKWILPLGLWICAVRGLRYYMSSDT